MRSSTVIKQKARKKYFLGSPVFILYLGDGAKQASGAKLHKLCAIRLQNQLSHLDYLIIIRR